MSTFSAAGTAVWLGKSRVVCHADTAKMAQYIAAALNAYKPEKKP